MVQAVSGIQVRRGVLEAASLLIPYQFYDYGTGMMGAFAVALALHDRIRTGSGQWWTEARL